MKLTNLRWWQWGMISLGVGAAVALAFTQLDPDNPSLQSVPFYQMKSRVERLTDDGNSLITRIRVSPVTTDGNGKKMQAVTYWERQRNRNTGAWDPTQQFVTRVPAPLSTVGNKTIMDYLAETKTRIPSLDYRFQWWLVPRTIWTASLIGSFLLIGVLWPIALKVMIKTGLAEPPDERMDLSAVRSTSEVRELSTGQTVTAGDQQKLADLTAAMEANVAGMSVSSPNRGEADRSSIHAPIKALGVDEAVTPTAPAAPAEDPNDFKGEFYPVARPVKKD